MSTYYTPWTFWESGTTGWTQIPNTVLPNPNAVPIRDELVSTRERHDLADGSRGYITPETKYNKNVVEFSWHFQSGFTVFDKLSQLCRDDTLLLFQGHPPGLEYRGKIKGVERTLVLFGTQDYKDITIKFEQIDD